MTLPDERYRAVQNTERFLRDLAQGAYPRVPLKVREQARALLRHYPNTFDLDLAAREVPAVFQRQMEPLYRMVLQHEQQQQCDESEGGSTD